MVPQCGESQSGDQAYVNFLKNENENVGKITQQIKDTFF
jgi:hypothetical protein